MYVGIDIGGTKCAVCFGQAAGISDINIVDRTAFPTPKDTGYPAVLARMCEIIASHGSREQIEAIGISCGGPLDTKAGRILSPPNLPGWDEVEITAFFSSRFHVPVALQNDANAGALAEWRYGAARGLQHVIFLTFGTGFGAGLILDGRLYEGASGMAGEAGHIRLSEYGPVGFGKAGSFEGFCSGGGLAELGRMKALEALQAGKSPAYCTSHALLSSITAKDIARAAKAGDETAGMVFDLCARKLGLGLAMLMDLINPQMIVLGSIFYRCQDLLYDTAMSVIRQEALPRSREACQVVPCALGESLGDYAALAVACMAAEKEEQKHG